mgnify:CR=1 FL=1
MKKIFSLVVAASACAVFCQQVQGQTLVVRLDDLGGAHSMNKAIIKCYQEGVGRSTEVLAVGPWFLEGAKLCAENPGLDVGCHLAITSEWAGYKWRPLTYCPSLCDEDGYLKASIAYDKPLNSEELERELRAQIELTKKYFPNVSHLTDHMMFSFAPGAKEVIAKLSAEYGLPYQGGPEDAAKGLNSLGMIGGYNGVPRPQGLLEALKKMEKGKAYWTIEHPAFDDVEMQGIDAGQPGQKSVGEDRQDVTNAFTSPEVIQYCKDNGIELISFAEFYNRAK